MLEERVGMEVKAGSAQRESVEVEYQRTDTAQIIHANRNTNLGYMSAKGLPTEGKRGWHSIRPMIHLDIILGVPKRARGPCY